MGKIEVTPAEEDEVVVAGDVGGVGFEAAPGRGPGAESGDGRREAALEDLEPPEMPLAQRIVIVAAVVCIIGALVYYFMAMR